MSISIELTSIDELLAKADELIQQINSDAINHMDDECRMQFQKHADSLKDIKAKVQDKVKMKGKWDIGSSAEGVHEAIQDIAKAMQDLKNNIF